MALSLEQFLERLADSSLLSVAEVQTLVDELPDERRPKDGQQLARELVRRKKLTAYQTQQVYSGKGKSLVLGNYVVFDKLGEGGMGMVLQAEHRRMKRQVAIKILSPAITKSLEALKRFQREVEAAARLEHPNIVTAYDADEAKGTHFLVMQYVAGSDLAALVKKQGPLPIEKALSCVLQAARGLEYAHTRGVVHRDIKPANLLMDSDGTVKILDMGLARLESAGAEQDQLTGTGQIMGTVDYMAPEQAADTKNADARADVYSLGITLWYLLTGRAAYEADTVVNKLMAHQNAPIPSLRAARPQVSTELDEVFAKMIAKIPDTRYQTMTEVIAALESCQAGSASALDVAVAPGEDTRLNAFLRSLESSGGSAQSKKPVAKKTAISTGLAETVMLQTAEVDTDPETQQSLVPPVAGPGVAGLPTPAVAGLPTEPPSPTQGLTEPGRPAVGSRAGSGDPRPARDSRPARQSRDRFPRSRVGFVCAAGVGALLLLLATIVFFLPTKDGVIRSDDPGGQALLSVASNQKTDKSARPTLAIAPFDAATAKKHQQAWADHLGVPVEKQVDLGGGQKLTMVLIPPGEFLMGSTDEEQAQLLEEAKAAMSNREIERIPSEGPQHQVRLTQPFWLSRYEVTRGQFGQFVVETSYETDAESDGEGGYGFVDGQWVQAPQHLWNTDLGVLQTDDTPVVNISWQDAMAFCQWVSKSRGGLKYDLPTEAQWEDSCRAGTTTFWHSGDSKDELREYAWFDENSSRKPHPVGQLRPNGFGVHDMCGSVWEWCADWFDAGYYSKSPESDPVSSNSGSSRVLRGGSWFYAAQLCRSAHRNRNTPSYRHINLGFRVSSSVR